MTSEPENSNTPQESPPEPTPDDITIEVDEEKHDDGVVIEITLPVAYALTAHYNFGVSDLAYTGEAELQHRLALESAERHDLFEETVTATLYYRSTNWKSYLKSALDSGWIMNTAHQRAQLEALKQALIESN